MLSLCWGGSMAICVSVSWRTCIMSWAFSGSAPARWEGNWGGGPPPPMAGGGFRTFGRPLLPRSLGSLFRGSRRSSPLKGGGLLSGLNGGGGPSSRMESDKSGLPAPIGLIPATAGGGTVGGIIGWTGGVRLGIPTGGTSGAALCNIFTAVSGSTILKREENV